MNTSLKRDGGGGNLFTVAFVLEYQMYLPKPILRNGILTWSQMDQVYDAFAKSFNFFAT